MRLSLRLTVVLLAAFIQSVWPQPLIETMDEADGWIGVGEGITVQRVEAHQSPAGVEGAGAIRCGIDVPGRTQVYLRCPVAQQDLSQYAQLRFRMYGALDASFVPLVTLIDSSWRHRQWMSPALGTRAREQRWTEFVVALDSPTQDLGADMADIQWITWFIIVPTDAVESGSLYIDGVRLDPRTTPPQALPGPEEVVLERDGYRARLSASRRYELVELTSPSGQVTPVRTRCQQTAMETIDDGGDTVHLGRELRWLRFDAEQGRASVDYTLGGYKLQNTFAWEEGMLRVQRRITAMHPGTTSAASRTQIVALDEGLSDLVYEHGDTQSRAALPAAEAVALPGNWVAATSGERGVAVVFPRSPLHRASVSGREFSVLDRITAQGCDVPAGAAQEYTIWLKPLGGEAAVRQMDASVGNLCSRLAERGDPVRAYFSARHQPSTPDESTLADLANCAIWQSSVSRTIGRAARPPARSASTIRLSAARGEVEPIHIAVYAKEGMGTLTVSCSELTSAASSISREQIRVRYPAYIHLRPSTESEQRAADRPDWAGYVGVIEGSDGHVQTDRFYGRSARVLGPVEDPLLDLPPATLEPGRNQPVWLTVTVPPDAAPGEYTGEIIIREDELELARIPVELRVWSFALPRVSSLRTWYQLWRAPVVDVDWSDYYRDLAEHKVSGFGGMPVEPGLSWTDGKVVVDWPAFDEAAAYLFDELGMRNAKFPHGKRGGNFSNVYPFLGFKPGTPEFDTAYEDYLTQARRHLAERGWLDGLDCYIFDEPDRERIETIRQTAPIIRRAVPDLRIFPACAANTLDLIGTLNAWCPPVAYVGAPVGDFTAKRIEEGRARGDAYWWYNQEDNAIGCPVVTHRALLWASWQSRMTGYFVWAINYWGTAQGRWVTPYEVGEAMAIYPGVNGPIDSLRWEQTREGLEDYEYLVLLEKSVAEGALAGDRLEQARAILAEARVLFPDPRCQLAADPEELLAFRGRIGALLDGQ